VTLPSCRYCGNESKRATGADLYPHRPDLASSIFYRCRPCDAQVGCHPGTDQPLGVLADAPLRRARQRAHQAFDVIWRGKGPRRIVRKEAYVWLSRELCLPLHECHIGLFDIFTCERVIALCKDKP
jgi:hypothetical protein